MARARHFRQRQVPVSALAPHLQVRVSESSAGMISFCCDR
jgi:hypothetical protein